MFLIIIIWFLKINLIGVGLLLVLILKEGWTISIRFMSQINQLLTLNITNTLKINIFIVTVSIISLRVMTWALFYMKGSTSSSLFFIVLFLFVLRMIILLLRDSFIFVFLGWEGLGITSFALIIFYQNWSSFSGGLITLLINRVGDAFLLTALAYFLLTAPQIWGVFNRLRLLLWVIVFLVAITKRAQIPFSRWLPAAIAAPTPVRALVHSSTLVTAGVWLLLRYLYFNFSILVIGVGFLTLLVARLAAIRENDSKKIVALSTLSQLGLIFISLTLGGRRVTLFHLIAHAFAKANLFIIVGNLIRHGFSQQDIRFMSKRSENRLFLLNFFISIFGLRGIMFTSGFFSKESILLSAPSQISSLLSFIIILRIVSLTFMYCLKLSSLLLSWPLANSITLKRVDFSLVSIRVITPFRVFLGKIFLENYLLLIPWVNIATFLCWTCLFLGRLWLASSITISKYNWAKFFLSQTGITYMLGKTWVYFSSPLAITFSLILEAKILLFIKVPVVRIISSSQVTVILILLGCLFLFF